MPDLPPLRGRLVDRTDESVVLATDDGRWTVRPEDVVSLDPVDAESGVVEPGVEVVLVVRLDAVVEVTQTTRLRVVEQPMTIPDEQPRVVGSERLSAAAAEWATLFSSADVCVQEVGSSSWMKTYDMNGDHVDGIAIDSLD
jgi:hypothetical protein